MPIRLPYSQLYPMIQNRVGFGIKEACCLQRETLKNTVYSICNSSACRPYYATILPDKQIASLSSGRSKET